MLKAFFIYPKISFCLAILSSIILLTAPTSFAQAQKPSWTAPQIVRINYLQGDVRLSRGDGKQPNLDKDWVQAAINVPIATGFSLATGEGRAEIEFENGSTIDLAENSLLLFRKLITTSGVPASDISLITGTLTIWFSPRPNETLSVHTPSDTLTFNEKSFLRIDSFLDATSITPRNEKGEDVIQLGHKTMHLDKGQTLTTKQGKVLTVLTMTGAGGTTSAPGTSSQPAAPTQPQSGQIKVTVLNASAAGSRQNPSPTHADWDDWVDARHKARRTEVAAALKASGLSAFVPGLTDLNDQGVFFSCKPYGQCWEPKDQHDADGADNATPQVAQNSTTQPNTQSNTRIEYVPSYDWANVVLRNAYELDPATKKPANMKSEILSVQPLGWTWAFCHSGSFVHFDKRIVFAPGRIHHSPPVVWVHARKMDYFVPRNPSDANGKPPVNLKYGAYLPAETNSGATIWTELNSSDKVEALNHPPKTYSHIAFPVLPGVAQPVIEGQFRDEGWKSNTLSGNQIFIGDVKVLYNFKTQQFAVSVPGAVGKPSAPVPVLNMTSHGVMQPIPSPAANQNNAPWPKFWVTCDHADVCN
ncbi:MAG TPA: FecR domain-containing protein [Candidatus Acidoferrum sp.]|nr:FecR domain-containing protein [Candidatus Acidoferrum sp.]